MCIRDSRKTDACDISGKPLTATIAGFAPRSAPTEYSVFIPRKAAYSKARHTMFVSRSRASKPARRRAVLPPEGHTDPSDISAPNAASRSNVPSANPGISLRDLQMLMLMPVRICPISGSE